MLMFARTPAHTLPPPSPPLFMWSTAFEEWLHADRPFQLKDVRRDNACFYHAISRQLRVHRAREQLPDVRDVHARIVEWILENWQTQMFFPDNPGCVTTVGEMAGDGAASEARDAYRAAHAQPLNRAELELGNDGWGGMAEAYAAAQVFGCDVEQYTLHYVTHVTPRGNRRGRVLRPNQRLQPATPPVRWRHPLQIVHSADHYRSIEAVTAAAARRSATA